MIFCMQNMILNLGRRHAELLRLHARQPPLRRVGLHGHLHRVYRDRIEFRLPAEPSS
ncbi:hypothetical protein CUJ84_pRLN4000121 (plasmid) [Rhizobium leguminosarum]|uniref:Uncharacterized protein n=1 Tax=Rhizobium leguminosarum TaxID=384 RepID=A0A2K9ZIG6_RHILE|nr:hypothetical protein CUJ84_pRLN4000121 [Rhizobium leguminosarum]